MADRILIFYDKNFPGYRPGFEVDDVSITVCNASNISNELQKGYSAFVNMHGEYFPVEQAEGIYGFLKNGGGFVNFFAPPLQTPVWTDADGQLKIGRKRLSYLRKLNIHCLFDVTIEDSQVESYVLNNDLPVAEKLLELLKVEDTKTMVLLSSRNKYIPSEWGSPGQMDMFATPLVKGQDGHDEHYSSPVLLLENRSGEYAGSRWIFINQDMDAPQDSGCFTEALLDLCNFAGRGTREFFVEPSYACYEAGERPSFRVQTQNLGRLSTWTCTFKLFHEEQQIAEKTVELKGASYSSTEIINFDMQLQPGVYRLTVDAKSEDGEQRRFIQGFCVKDHMILKKLNRISCGKDYFIINGESTPVIGTTYMSGTYSRAFLHLPNVGEWMHDMLDMRKQGITWIRTGMWCNWRTYMLDDGHMDERVLRSIDAFIQCAAAAGLHVTFTFFTFNPVLWEGTHPYLDRRSVEAQKRFIAAIVDRHRNTTNVDWDLMNEPYTSDHPSQRRTDNDLYEPRAFQEYLGQKYETNWDMNNDLDLTAGSFGDVPLPSRGSINFDPLDVGDSKNGLIWRDYIHFTIEMFNDWVRELTEMIKEINPGCMVTFGQDEGLRSQRPTPLLCGHVMDYSTQHPWFYYDNLAWDMIFTKYPGKPHLAQETGIIHAESPDGMPRRTEYESMLLLQKKYAYAFGTGSAGVLNWLWNTNPFMNNANESHIGAIHADGSKKPEMRLSQRFSDFFGKAHSLVTDISENPEVAVVFPFTNDFSNRNFAQHSTVMAANALLFGLNTLFTGISEFDLEPLRDMRPKLIIVPSPHHFRNDCFDKLLDIVDEIGATLLFTGPISLDEYFQKTDRAYSMFGATTIVPLSHYEYSSEADSHFYFDRGYSNSAFKEIADETGSIMRAKIGKGNILWTGLPVELSENRDLIVKIYSLAMKEAGITGQFTVQGGEGMFISRIGWEKAALYTIINENGRDEEVRITDDKTGNSYIIHIPKNDCELFVVSEEGLAATYNDKTKMENGVS